jgi:hypothetical protein
VETRGGTVLPLEVKSGSAIRRHATLDNIIREPNYNIRNGIVLSNQNIEKNGNITYLPVYCASRIEGILN